MKILDLAYQNICQNIIFSVIKDIWLIFDILLRTLQSDTAVFCTLETL